MQLFKAISRFKTKKKIKSVTIELNIRKNKLDAMSETLIAARKIVRLGLAKNAEEMPWGIRAINVPADRLNDLKRHRKSMGEKRKEKIRKDSFAWKVGIFAMTLVSMADVAAIWWAATL